jgi:hypothetical protein
MPCRSGSPRIPPLPHTATTWYALVLRSINRLHAVLAQLIPAGPARVLTAETAAAALRSIRLRAVLVRTVRQVAVELLGEVRRLFGASPRRQQHCPPPSQHQALP